MSMLTVRDLDPEVKEKLRRRAARHGRSMEAEARAVLLQTFGEEVERPDVDAVRARVRRAQELIAPHLPKDRPLADEFLAERKKMWGEE